MPWTGTVYIRDNGVFTGPLVWTDDRDAGTKITSAHHDTHDQDIADGITACLNKNGNNSPTANINWGNFKVVNMAYGADDHEAAAYGQVPIAASLDPTTNILTLTRSDGLTFTVDLSALAVGGSTAPFARLAADQTFTGANIFTQPLVVGNRITMNSTTVGQSWRLDTPTNALWTLAATGGCVFNFFSDSVYGLPGGAITIGGYRVWDESRLTPDQVTNLVSATQPATISGAWTFTNANNKFVPFLWTSAVGGGDWAVGPATATEFVFNDPIGLSPMVYTIDSAPISGAFLQIGPSGAKVWETGSFRVIASAAPTGGEANNVALVLTGANQGFWANVSGTWTKIIAGP